MAWMKEHLRFANADVPVTGEFCIFDFYFKLNLVINLASSLKKG